MNSNLKGAQKILASLTMVTTMLSVAGFAALAPVTALAAVPADYGLHEGDTVSVDGTPGTQGYDPDIYIVNELGYKRLFLNPAIFSFYGHLGGFANVKKISAAARDAFPTSGLFRNCETNDQRVYGVEITAEDNGVLHWVNTTGAQAAIDDPNFFKKVFCINTNEFNWYPKGSDYTSVNQVPDYNRGGSTGSPTPTPGQGGLNGGAGSLDNADFIGSLNNEEVGESENNIAVTGLDLEADSGSDLRVISVKVAFEEDGVGNASEDLDDYSDEVSLWFDGKNVGSADVSDFDEDNGVWSKSISLTGDAVIRMDQTEQLKVAVSALSNLDSDDLDDNAWSVAVESVRYVDAQGAITTETSLDDIGDINGDGRRPFTFESFSAAADLELEVDEASDNPDSRVVDVDDNSATDDILLMTGTLDATGGDITVKELTVNIASTGADLDVIASSIDLEIDGDVVQTLQTSECAGNGDCVFDDVDQDIAEDDSVKFRVLANIEATDDIGVEGATLTATVDSADIDAEDENGDDLDAGDKTGTALGEQAAFYSEGIQVTFVSASASKTTGDAEPDLGTFIVKFDVKAFDTDAFVDADGSSCAVDLTPPTPPAVNDQGVIFSMASASTTSCVVTNGDDETANSNFQVSNGSTEHFTLTVAAEGLDEFAQLVLESINWASSDLAAPNQFYTFSLDDFKTDNLYLSLL